MTENKKVDFKLTREGLVKIEHSKTKGVAKVLPESVPAWLESGWSVADPDDSAQAVVVTVDEEKRTGAAGPAKEK